MCVPSSSEIRTMHAYLVVTSNPITEPHSKSRALSYSWANPFAIPITTSNMSNFKHISLADTLKSALVQSQTGKKPTTHVVKTANRGLHRRTCGHWVVLVTPTETTRGWMRPKLIKIHPHTIGPQKEGSVSQFGCVPIRAQLGAIWCQHLVWWARLSWSRFWESIRPMQILQRKH